MKAKLKQIFTGGGYNRLKKFGLRLLSLPFSHNLTKLAKIYSCDKYGKHFYTKAYQAHFRKFRYRRIKLFEIGVGGYHFPYMGGNSLRMWKSYFPLGRIYSLDIYDKSFVQEYRIKIFQGSQTDKQVLDNIIHSMGKPEIIIDDGSHINSHVIETFLYLFPILKEGGIYVIEDTQTSYWPDYGGDSENLNNQETTMNFFKRLVDGINHEEYLLNNYNPTYFDQHIVSIHFYHNLIFVYKGNNREGSSADFRDPQSVLKDPIFV